MGVENPPSLGTMLREKREREGLSLREAGSASGIAFSTLGRLESGANPSLKVDRLARSWLNGEAPTLPTPPMTLRDWFAGQAIGAVIRQCAGDVAFGYPEGIESIEQMFAVKAYAIADAMLAERTRGPA